MGMMLPEKSRTEPLTAESPFTTPDVVETLRTRGWLVAEPAAEQFAWCERAAALLGPYAAGRAALADLLALVFQYDARQIIAQVDAHVVLSRYAARDVVRQLALLLLDGAPLTSERFKEIISALKDSLDLRGRELFHPLRLALAGRAGEGDLDRVILLLDEAAPLPFSVSVKSARARILEFCAALG
jgi:nondiscriminating glutamyl-tRNA synthetase